MNVAQNNSLFIRNLSRALRPALPLAVAAILSACAPQAPGTDVKLTSAPDLAGAAAPGAMIWRSPDLGEHERVSAAYYIPPATVYRGDRSYYDGLSTQQQDDIAAALTRQVRAKVGSRFKVVQAPAPGVFTLQVVLVSVNPPHQEYVSSGPYSISELAVGMPNSAGLTTGSMTVAGKFLDSQTDKLLVAFSVPVSPASMDLTSTGSAVDFVQASADRFASQLLDAIVKQRENTHTLPAR